MKQPAQNIKGNNLLVGRNPVVEALEDGIEIDKVFLQLGIRGEVEKQVRKLCQQHQVPLVVVPKEKLNQFFRGNHQGIIAVASMIQYQRLDKLLPFAFEQQQQPLFVLLDGITDVRNFGAIARSCEVFGAQALIISKKSGALINEDAVKTSAGALLRLPVCREQSLGQAVEYLQDSGVAVLCSDLKATRRLQDCDLAGPVAIVMGSEDKGVNPDLLHQIRDRFIIPQNGQTDSLNVSVATGIILYEITRQRHS